MQEYYLGAWHANTAIGCAKLNRSSMATGIFWLNQADLGYHYRVRADYISRDSTNASSDSAWQYLIVTR